jgi:dephospho-CoA kinase
MKAKLVGLTGNIGSGKSTVAKFLVERGAVLIDADHLARQATEDPEILQQIADVLGEDLFKDGRLDRVKTAAKVFHDEQSRRALGAIIHPWVRRKSAERVESLQQQQKPPALILMDVPLLYENGLEQEFDTVIVVTAPLELRLARVQAGRGFSEEEVRARDAAQMPLEEKVERADFVLDNSGTPERLERQVARLWQRLTS